MLPDLLLQDRHGFAIERHRNSLPRLGEGETGVVQVIVWKSLRER